MNIGNDVSMQFIKLGLDASALRGKVIANNMANINTDNFKKSYVSFEENLDNAKNEFTLKRTKKVHLNGELNDSLISVKEDNSTSMRTDGNNVDMDLEKVNQASNTLMYNALITQANSKLNMTKAVISGGNV
ncbi:MAG: flagellar basal body rod protein FlgB [Clostridium sp.]|uniref:flagellar basal body rod protein FlgB n=1 Tax=Clostridium sp. TaxID=1506 RepID=UPI0025C34C66|nr:flagellar basal body rod protein FlgB [Clostridium sp.]MCF0149745.1 flagellar basal body rod protein FlgB [Clostridium sp.]